jgi:Tfp pilus assembly protein PilX
MELTSRTGRADDDRGSVLLLTLVMAVVLSIIALGLASYAATGLRTSQTTTLRTSSSTTATSGMFYMLEELTTKRTTPCTTATTTPVPTGLVQPARFTVAVLCVPSGPIDGHPAVALAAVVTESGRVVRRIDAVVAVPRFTHTVQIDSWKVSG